MRKVFVIIGVFLFGACTLASLTGPRNNSGTLGRSGADSHPSSQQSPSQAVDPEAAQATLDERDEQVQEYIATASDYLAVGQFGLGIATIQQALALDPESVDAIELDQQLREAQEAQISTARAAEATATTASRQAAAQATAEASIRRFEGRGQTAIDAFALPAEESIVMAAHNGRRNFIVHAYIGNRRELLINTVGEYRGDRLLSAKQPVSLNVEADGNWLIQVVPVSGGGQPAFSGNGDAVGSRFNPPGLGAWEFSHSGRRNFIVHLHCNGRRSLIQNTVGEFSGSKIVEFGRGPCFWEVQADGAWSLTPRS